jgi:2-methylcitrate dehydratase PrpD
MKRSLALGLVVASIASQAFAQEVAPAPLSERLGAVVAQARYDALSSEVRRRLDLTVADNLASLVAATPEHCDDAFIARLRQRGGAREALLPGCGFRLPAEEAAAAIAYLIHANETDDSDFRSELRASPHVFGAALAAAQAANADGETFLTALAAGYSIQAALAAPFGPLQPRYMTSGVWGPIGAAAVSSRAYGLSGEETSAALALAASSAAGPFQYFYD